MASKIRVNIMVFVSSRAGKFLHNVLWSLQFHTYLQSLTSVYRATIGNREGSSPTETKTKAMKKTKTKTKTLGQTIWIWFGRQNIGTSQATAQHQLFSRLCSHTRRLNRPSSFKEHNMTKDLV